MAVEVDQAGPVFPGPWWNSRMRRILILVGRRRSPSRPAATMATAVSPPSACVQVGEATVRARRRRRTRHRGSAGSRRPGEPRRRADRGMLFLLADDSPAFWMKGMRFPIDIVWIRDGREVVDVSARACRPRRQGPETRPLSDLLSGPAGGPRAGGERRRGHAATGCPPGRQACGCAEIDGSG